VYPRLRVIEGVVKLNAELQLEPFKSAASSKLPKFIYEYEFDDFLNYQLENVHVKLKFIHEYGFVGVVKLNAESG
jgi:hypothetical protein